MPLVFRIRGRVAARRTVSMVAASIMAVLLTSPPMALAHAPSRDVPPGYVLVWSDEFGSEGLPDPGKWIFDTSRNKVGWHNNELQYYAGPGGTNAMVKGGRLHITARKESPSGAADWGGQRYTSARLKTSGKAQWARGFFEIRAKVSCGKGAWPAIWMLGSKGSWPEDGELDIMEYVGSAPDRVTSAVHMAAGHGGHSVSGAIPVPRACEGFHRYQMHWTADAVTFAVDGFAHLRYPRLDAGRRAWPFDEPHYLLLNIAVGGDLGGQVDDRIFPATMEIDYVRVYQTAESKRP